MATAEQVVHDAVEEWRRDWPEKKLRQYVHRLLDEHIEDVLLQLTGFERDRWRREWRVSRAGSFREKENSTLADYIRRQASDVIVPWINDNIDKLPRMNDAMVQGYIEYYQECYERNLREHLRTLAEEHAFQDARKYIDKIKDGIDVNVLKEEPEREAPGWHK